MKQFILFAVIAVPMTTLAGDRRPQSVPTDCPDALVHYIPVENQFLSAPTPIEDHSEHAFCASDPLFQKAVEKLKAMRPIRSRPNDLLGRIKIQPRSGNKDSFIICQNGEITFQGKQYRLPPKFLEPALEKVREIADREEAKRKSLNASDSYAD